MATVEHDTDVEAIADRAKTRYRGDRRPSVQFIDKNLIRRRSSGLEKTRQYTSLQQSPRLPSINVNEEAEEPNDEDQQQPTLQEEQLPKQYCESLEKHRNSLQKKNIFIVF